MNAGLGGLAPPGDQALMTATGISWSLAIPALDAGEVVLNDAVAPLAEILAQRLFHARVDLLVVHLAVRRVGRELEKRPEQNDTLHAHLEVGHRRHLAGDLDHVGEIDAQLLGADRAAVMLGNPLPDLARVVVWRLHEDGARPEPVP